MENLPVRKDEKTLEDVPPQKEAGFESFNFDDLFEKDGKKFYEEYTSWASRTGVDPKEIIDFQTYRNVVEKRIETKINFVAGVASLKQKYIDTGLIEKDSWIAERILNIIGRAEKMDFERGFQIRPLMVMQGKLAKFKVPFAEEFFEDYTRLYSDLQEMFKEQPDVILATPNSGIFPAMIIKEIIKKVKESDFDLKDWKPEFPLLPNKSFKLLALGEMEKLEDKKGFESDADFIELMNYIKSVLQKMYADDKSDILIFDEFHGRGGTVRALREVIYRALDELQMSREASPNYKISIKRMTMGSNEVFYGGDISEFGKNVVGDKPVPLKGKVLRHFFKILGDALASDYLTLKSSGLIRKTRSGSNLSISGGPIIS